MEGIPILKLLRIERMVEVSTLHNGQRLALLFGDFVYLIFLPVTMDLLHLRGPRIRCTLGGSIWPVFGPARWKERV